MPLLPASYIAPCFCPLPEAEAQKIDRFCTIHSYLNLNLISSDREYAAPKKHVSKLTNTLFRKSEIFLAWNCLDADAEISSGMGTKLALKVLQCQACKC